jgi:hypothetical protein
MALPEETPRVLYNGSGTRGPFSLSVGGTPISFADGSQIVITRYDADGVGTPQVEGTHYELSAETALPDMGDTDRPIATASFTFKLAQPVLAVGQKVLAERVSTVEQGLVLALGGGFSAPANERNLDAIIRVSQELANKLARVVTINTLDANGALELPAEADRAGKVFTFDDDGNPTATEVGPGIGDLLAANNLSDLASVATARTNLGLGSAAVLASSALFQVSNNLSEGNATTMRSNLGLGAIALLSVGDTISVTATGGSTERSLADRFAETIRAEDYGVVSGSVADQSTNMQLAITAAAGKRLELPDADIYCKNLQFPHEGLELVGVTAAYSVTGLGTRLILPNSSNTYIVASESYVNNRAYSNYGVIIHGVCFDGNKANQASASPLVILRTSRSWLHDNVGIENSKGIGLLLTAKSANNTATNSMPENMIQARFKDCDEEAIYGANDSANNLADVFIHNALLAFCGGGATKKHSIYMERSAGVIVSFCKFYGTGKGELYLGLAGRTIVTSNHFDADGTTQTTGTVNTVEIVMTGTSANAHAVVNGNIFHMALASAGAVTWQHLSITGGGANSIVTVNGNTFYSQSFSMTGIAASGTAAITLGANSFYQCTEPSPSATFRKLLQSNASGTWTIAEAVSLSSTLAVTGAATFSAGVTQSLAGGGAISYSLGGEGSVNSVLSRYSADAVAAAATLQKARGTIASPSAVAQFDEGGRNNWNYYASGAFRTAAYDTTFMHAATPSSTDLEADRRFFLCAAGSATPTEILRARWSQGIRAFPATAVPAGGTAGLGYTLSSTTNLGVFFGSGAPTLSAAQGSLYIRTDGSSTTTRLYVNTNGATTWTNVTTAA